MIEFKTKANLTIFLDLDSIFSIEQKTHVVGTETRQKLAGADYIKEVSYLDWVVRTKHNTTYEVTEKTALHLVELKTARIREEEEEEDRTIEEEIRKAPPHYAENEEEEEEEENLEEWQKDPDDWNK